MTESSNWQLKRYNVVVIDCSNITSQIRESLIKFITYIPENAEVIFVCLHGHLPKDSFSEVKLCNGGAHIRSLQEVLGELLTYNTEYLHIVTANVVCINLNYVSVIQSFKNLNFWTPSTLYDGGVYDIRRKYWWTSKMSIHWVNDLQRYWTSDRSVPKLEQMPLTSIVSSFLGGIERLIPNMILK